jgi:hypothetical protein
MSMVELAERKAHDELQMHDGTLPANCCTIIAWYLRHRWDSLMWRIGGFQQAMSQ